MTTPPSLQKNLGGINHGYIGIIMRDKIYAKISRTPYVAPMDPGGTSIVTDQATTA